MPHAEGNGYETSVAPMAIKTIRLCGNDNFQLKIATNLRIATESLLFCVNEIGIRYDVAPSRIAVDALVDPMASRSRTELRRLATVACHNLEAAGRRHTGLPAWNDNGDQRIALDAALTQKGNSSELRSSLPINTRGFLRAVRVS